MKEFKLIVAGGRDFIDYDELRRSLLLLCNHGELKDYAVSIVCGWRM